MSEGTKACFHDITSSASTPSISWRRTPLANERIDLLIVTPVGFAESRTLARFVQHKRAHGYSVSVATLDECYRESAESACPEDEAASLKRFIDRFVDEHKTSYILLGGDVDVLPMHSYRWNNFLSAGHAKAGHLASDAYYQGREGRLDVAIGRVPASNRGEFNTYLSKVIDYESADEQLPRPISSDRAVIVLSDRDHNDHGDAPSKLDHIFKGGNLRTHQLVPRGYKGYTDAGTDITTFYSGDPGTDQTIDRLMDNGALFLAQHGHANRAALGWILWSGNVDTRGTLPIIVAGGCTAAGVAPVAKIIDGIQFGEGSVKGIVDSDGRVESRPAAIQPLDADGIAEDLLVRSERGAVAFIGTTNINWDQGYRMYRDYLKNVLLNPNESTGKHFLRAQRTFIYGTVGGNSYASSYSMVIYLGDPTMRVMGPWQYERTPFDPRRLAQSGAGKILDEILAQKDGVKHLASIIERRTGILTTALLNALIDRAEKQPKLFAHVALLATQHQTRPLFRMKQVERLETLSAKHWGAANALRLLRTMSSGKTATTGGRR